MKSTDELPGVVLGIVASKVVYTLTRELIDPTVVKYFYETKEYVSDLVRAGYTHGSGETEEQIATHITETSGYTFSGGPGNLTGVSRLTANEDTYMAAVRQKLEAYMFPSTWLTMIEKIVYG
ncbi:MAG: hypothetical protein AEth_01249 [Candidatus Argoarchaeum ethanivorans]|uniref:Uncharacterized protein n=1 Tax=Candidatus Argoarchaeum ethanivorans TaxID=2608793 RepID=A0A8B3S1S4_9EURY|nr:MAG: hypothetical protein AEth_01249 [Candidatus Argoarchaeum ethanivorans]